MINSLCYSIVYLVFNFCLIVGQNLPQNPCPEYFSYQHNGNEYIGVIQIVPPTDTTRIQLDITMTIGAALRSDYIGSLKFMVESFNQENERTYIYNVNFPSGPIPKLKRIVVNNQQICSGSAVQANYVTTIELGHTRTTRMTYTRRPEKAKILSNSYNDNPFLNTDDYELINYQPTWNTHHHHSYPIQNTNQELPSQPYFPVQQSPPVRQLTPVQQTPVQQPTAQTFVREPTVSQANPPPSRNTNARSSIQCGVLAPRFHATPLIVNGEDIERGSWPWLAAVYSYNTDTLKFICGGNLISSRAVLTAAHCFVQSSGSRTPPENCLVQLGRHNRSQIRENGMEEKPVSQIIVHEDYGPTRSNGYDADLAIIVLQTALEFTDYIRPICLPNRRDQNSLRGTVVGWGRTEFNILSPIPKKINAPIVTEAECVRSNENFKPLISSRTFCAGFRNGSGPCVGDSGGALGIEINSRWYIHGTVSASLASTDSNCDLSNYIIYADISLFVDWIRGHITE